MTEQDARPVANPDRTQIDGQHPPHPTDDEQDNQQGPPEDDDPQEDEVR
jgi:hypothetical protein